MLLFFMGLSSLAKSIFALTLLYLPDATREINDCQEYVQLKRHSWEYFLVNHIILLGSVAKSIPLADAQPQLVDILLDYISTVVLLCSCVVSSNNSFIKGLKLKVLDLSEVLGAGLGNQSSLEFSNHKE